jgi:hypothetical protein
MSKEKISKEKISEKAMTEELKNQGSEVQEPKIQEPKIQELRTQETKGQEPRHPAITLHENKRPANLPANAMPVDGYVLSIDGKLKKRFDTSEAAMTAGVKLKQDYPVIQVAVFDAAARSYTPVALPEK